MNRAIAIVAVPALLVALGYVAVLRRLGHGPGVWSAALLLGIAGAGIWALMRRGRTSEQRH